MDRMCSLISGSRRSMPMTWVTRARVTPSRRAMSAWLAILPESRRACHSMALRKSSTTRGVPGSLGGLGVPRTCRTAPHHPGGSHPARQGTNIAALERPLRAEGDLDGLFVVSRRRGDVVAILVGMDDPEPDLGVRLTVDRHIWGFFAFFELDPLWLTTGRPVGGCSSCNSY